MQLTSKARARVKTWGLPGEKKYPMPDKSHAANAKARASQQEAKGNLSASQKAKIDAKANKVLGKKGDDNDEDDRAVAINGGLDDN